MSKRPLQPGERVTVKTGMHINACRTVLRREGAGYLVRLDSGTTRQYLGSSLTKMGSSLRRVAA